jgi:hypothetical protein
MLLHLVWHYLEHLGINGGIKGKVSNRGYREV